MPEYLKLIREKVGHMPLLLAGVSIIIYKEGKVLLQKRSDNHLWDIHGGIMELSETAEEAVERELWEEIGIKPVNSKFYFLCSGEATHGIYPNGDECYFLSPVYLCNEWIGTLKADQDEVLELKWFSIDQLPEEMRELDRVVLKRFVTDFKQGNL